MLRNVTKIHLTKIQETEDDHEEEIEGTEERTLDGVEDSDSEEEEIGYRVTDGVENEVRPELRDPPYKVRKGQIYEIKKIGEDVTRRVKIMSRVGKAKGKYKHLYNVREE